MTTPTDLPSALRRIKELDLVLTELSAVLEWIASIIEGETVSEFALSFGGVQQVMDLVDERDALRKGFARATAESIMKTGGAYEAGLVDAKYKVCDKCGTTCIPTCVACDESQWEKTSQVYFDENVELRTRLKTAVGHMRHWHSGGCLRLGPCTICTFLEKEDSK